MADEKIKDWRQLCSQASVEQDPQKLLEIITELEKALDERDKLLNPPLRKPA